MITLQQAYKECRNINSKTVSGIDVLYMLDNTDTACITTIGDTDYHLFDGTSNILEVLKDLLAITGKRSRNGAFLSYDPTAEDFFNKARNRINFNKRNVFFGISRGGAIATDYSVYFAERCMRMGIRYPNMLTVPIVSPPAGGRKLKRHCQRLDFQCLRIDMKGGLVPTLPLWGKHYETEHIVLNNNERGWLHKHLNVYKYLPNRDI